jgi:uncharacterized membrane protein YkgB
MKISKEEHSMDTLFTTAQRIAAPFLRISLGIILLWIGALKFVDPSPVVELLGASLPFLASAGFVYIVGVFEVLAALALILGIGVRYVGLLVLALFAGTLTIFAISPAVTGFPFLNMAGEFLLKDLVLFAATFTVIAADYAKVREHSTEAQPDLRRA